MQQPFKLCLRETFAAFYRDPSDPSTQSFPPGPLLALGHGDDQSRVSHIKIARSIDPRGIDFSGDYLFVRYPKAHLQARTP